MQTIAGNFLGKDYPMNLGCVASSFLALVWAVASVSAAEPTLTLDLGDGVQMELLLIPKGTFQQGSPVTEAGRGDDETPRQVTIRRDFYLGKFPVTRGQFERWVRATGYRTEAERGPSGGFGFDGAKLVQRKEFAWRNPGFRQTDTHPVTLVTFDDAQAFVAWLAKKTGRSVSLPTEAQWEYACRAGATTRFYNGDAAADAQAVAWFQANAGDGTRPVGQKQPNRFGLYDMCGNVYQWCRDWYGPYPPGAVTDPEETRSNLSEPSRRVLRGGSWLREVLHCRSAARYRNTPGSRNADNSFRIVVAVEPQREQDGAGQAFAGTTPVVLAVTHAGSPLAVAGMVLLGGGLICFALAGGGVLAIVMLILLRRHRQGTRADWLERLRPQIENDGFWLDTTGVAAGSVIRYRCSVLGEPRTGSLTVEPGAKRQFVYTGGRPSGIEVLAVVPPQNVSDEDIEQSYQPYPDDTGQTFTPPAPLEAPASSDFPAAY